jgi:hypothetical protein
VPLTDDLEPAMGIDGQNGSGVYAVNENNESQTPKALTKLLDENMVAQVRDRIEADTQRVLAAKKDG